MKCVLSYLLFLSLCLGVNATTHNKTNVVLILIDDLSHYGVTVYGANRVGSLLGDFENAAIATPNIDKLAVAGMMCSNAFAYPLCENSRIALMSGKYNSRNLLKVKSQHESDITIGDIFKRAGYSTGIFGKWKQTRGTSEIPGKDYIFEFGWDQFCCFDVVGEGQRYINPNMVINGEVHDYTGRTDLDPETGRRWYGPDLCNRYALKFIEENKDKPFLLYYPMLLVHDEHKPTPDTKPDSLFDNFDESTSNKDGHRGDDRKYFPDMIRYMDKLIGKVVDKVDELGLSEKTLFVVLGDNGTKECFSHVFTNDSIYPGRKGGNMDNGLHVPLVMKLPGQIPSGKGETPGHYDGMVDIVDVLPTICDAAGVSVPHRDQLDGISFWEQALGHKGEPRKHIYTWYNGNNLSSDLKDLLVYAFDKNFKRYAPSKEYPEGRFFDLRIDPLETHGDTVFKRKFSLMLYSGLNLDKLTNEQQSAYHRLGEIIDANTYQPVKSIEIIRTPVRCEIGKKEMLDYSVFPQNATRKNVIWESENPEIATIDKFGEITPLKAGRVKINIYSWDDAYPTAANFPITYNRDGITDSIEIIIK